MQFDLTDCNSIFQGPFNFDELSLDHAIRRLERRELGVPRLSKDVVG